MDLAPLDQALRQAGFEGSADLHGQMQQLADAFGMSQNGAYTVLAVYSDGVVHVQVEQTNAPLQVGTLLAQVQYPEVCVVEGPSGRVCADPSDVPQVLSLIEDVR